MVLKNISAAVALSLVMLGSLPALAAPDTERVVQGYARPDYRDLLQTAIVLGGLDIADPQIAEHYARITECSAYKQFYADDFSWNAVRQKVVDRVRNKTEFYRSQFEYEGVAQLGSYDFSKQFFPFSKETQFANVGLMEIMPSQEAVQFLCTVSTNKENNKPVLPLSVALNLAKPLNVPGFGMSPKEAEALLASLPVSKEGARKVYLRFRFKVSGQPTVVKNRKGEMARIDLPGSIEAIDIFRDSAMTSWMTTVPVP